MNQKILFEINKFASAPVFFSDRNKISNFEKVIKNLPKNSTIIIREYDLSKNSREIFAQKIINLARGQELKYLKILVGKDFALARKIKADGVHFSDFDRLPLQFLKNKSFPKKFIFSLACHNLKSALNSLNSKFLRPNIVFISPIFATSSHVDAKTFNLKNLAKISFKAKNSNYFRAPTSKASPQFQNPSIYALGGINSENIKQVRKLAISGFAAIDLFKEDL